MEMVSVVVPVYNAEKYLEQMLESLVAQTYQNLEMILVDDGSTDHSNEILKDFAQKDKRIKITKKCNEGPGTARNMGMKLAVGKYIIFLDADDYFEECMIEMLVEALENWQAEFAMCKAFVYDEQYKRKKAFRVALNENILKDKPFFYTEEVYCELLQVTGGFVWNKLFRTDFLKSNQIEFANTYIYEDMFVTMQCLIIAEKVAVVNKELITYRTNNKGSLSINKDSRWKEMTKVFQEIYKKIIQKNLYGRLEKTYLNRLADVLYTEFTSYTQESAVIGLYGYYKDCLMKYYYEKEADFFYKPKIWKLIDFLNGNSSVVGFLLSFERYRTQQFKKDFHKLEEQNRQLARQKRIKHWLLPYGKIPYQCKVILYGAGEVGKDYYGQISTTGWCRIIQWVDKKAEYYRNQGYPVNDLTELDAKNADYIIVCISDRKIAEEMKNFLQQAGVAEKQILMPEIKEN